jgi:uncharacterized protein
VQVAELIFLVIAVLAGAYVRGYSGFGSALLWVSSLSFILPPVQVIPTVFMLDVVASVQLLPKVWKQAHWRSLRWLLLGTLMATPPGIYLLATSPATSIRIAIYTVILATTILLWHGLKLRRIPGGGPTLLTGLVSGLLNGATGIAGPPAILLYLSSPASVAVARASIIAFLSGTHASGIILAAGYGLITGDVLIRMLLLLPVVFAGITLGNRRFLRTEPETFRRFVLLFLGALAVVGLVRAFFYS